ncbi:hypothetical protein A3742_11850 [Oleiphilus sp. HI0071]|uniref:nucleotidyltransferase family protein n=1 Tax=unclassified Oleiphilus TaxID=2631174 RepID=UPI0007C2D218|nr:MULTISPECIES: nucleotidyltransferase family protein [unclassified Oleiphilus]KZY61629.1 hypothetical protein A3737_05205 [Oleiphilus sp. HI0065]KZY81254.1 hypothetical protein A3742_11850 [Oleiphilus sp. HI0071]KZY92585.1 hypothetical protein A3744_02490 [Oleiphilus sp. HI0073]KZZ47886.1 hypothetical protein A3760_24475 [Oleiphilus sp. HI0122]KZZ50540.1 hypothetical protein A3758_12625 [Oleiphilus sp. HI0118]KZZ70215.1 hypothetical protein A3765_16740 [Oleiphilus sp. HI0130]KZZ82485.1 hyp
MRAMILAAGLGSRMRPLTDHCPKPLLKAAQKPLIDYHLERLESLGVERVAINTHWLGHLVIDHLEQNWQHRLKIDIYPEKALLETAGGIVNALASLKTKNDAPFLLINGDVYFEEDLSPWLDHALHAHRQVQANLLLCQNPCHNPSGDFDIHGMDHTGCARLSIKADQADSAHNARTYSGIGLYRPSVFTQLPPGPAPLGPILRQLAQQGGLYGSEMRAFWLDVGTPERLNQLDQRLRHDKDTQSQLT